MSINNANNQGMFGSTHIQRIAQQGTSAYGVEYTSELQGEPTFASFGAADSGLDNISLSADFGAPAKGIDFVGANATPNMQQLAQQNLPPEGQYLAAQLANLDPQSAQAQQAQAQIAALWTGSPQDLQKFQAMGASSQVNQMIASLNSMKANLDPQSAQAQQVQAQIDALTAKRDSLQQFFS